MRRDGENVLAVRVRNEGRNSRWYSGSGIYRHVWLNATGSVRVPLWGILRYHSRSFERQRLGEGGRADREPRAVGPGCHRPHSPDRSEKRERRHARGAAIARRRRQRQRGAGAPRGRAAIVVPGLRPQLYRAEVDAAGGRQCRRHRGDVVRNPKGRGRCRTRPAHQRRERQAEGRLHAP